MSLRRVLTIALFLGLAFAALGVAVHGDSSSARRVCEAELRSWIVAGRGRHLYLEIRCPPPHQRWSGRVEFTQVNLRRDYDLKRALAQAPRVGRMSRGMRLASPLGGQPGDRLEYRYRLTAEQARALQRDRLWMSEYRLLGSNSNRAMRAVLEEAGLRLPSRVLQGGGVLGEFPGIGAALGDEVPPRQWPAFGLPSGPTMPPTGE